MKTLLKTLGICLIAAFTITSCNDKDDFDYDRLLEEQRIKDSIENARVEKILEDQAPVLAAYASSNFTNPVRSDSTGIWYDIVNPGTANSYIYRLQPGAYSLTYVAPTITVRYKGQLLDGTVFDEIKVAEHPNGTTFSNWGNLIPSWFYAFFPTTLSYEGKSYKTGGLTISGLQKGTKIKFVTPSPYGYDNVEQKKDGKVSIPKDSPLVFEIEVLDIK